MKINLPIDVIGVGAAFGIAQGYILAWGNVPAQPEPTMHELWLLPAMVTWGFGITYLLCRMMSKDWKKI